MALLPLAGDVHLIACDVDGTLLTSQHVIHERTVAAIHHIRRIRPELPIIISSGKQFNSCEHLRRQLHLDGFPASHAHGSVIYGGDERVKWSVSLPPSTILPLIEELRLANRATFVFTETRVLLVNAEVGGPDWLEIAGRYDKNVEDHVAGREAVLADIASGKMTIIKVTVVAEPENVETLMASLRTSYPDLGLTRAIPFILELHDPHTDKGTALQYICDSLGLKTVNAMVFGDGENDVAMFRKAGYSVAMGNGMQAAKAAASHQCPSNDEGGVGQFLSEVFGRGAAL